MVLPAVPAFTVAWNVRLVLAPLARVFTVQLSPAPVGSLSSLLSPPVMLAATYVTPAGTTSVTTMFAALSGPLLVSCTV